ncbi:unnamed protein product [Caenorhabditis brenneri]
MSEFSNSLWSGSCNSEDEPQFFDLSELSSPDSFPGKKSRSTSPELQLDPTKRPPYSFNAIIAMAYQSSPKRRLRLQKIYEYISTNFPYYSAKKSSGWKSSVRHNLSIHSHFQEVKSEDDESLLFDSSVSSSPHSSIGQESSSTSPGLDLDSTKRPSFSFNSIIAMAIQSSPQKRMRLQEIYDYISTNFPEMKCYWEMNCDFGTDVYIREKSGNLLPTMTLQNQVLIQMMIQNYQLQQCLRRMPAIGTLPFPPFLMNEVPKKEE